MDENRTTRALAGLILAALLSPALLPGILDQGPPPVPPLEPPVDAAIAAELGWPIAPDEPDPSVWSALSGIGPARARTLADAATAGDLATPDDLLRVPGFGIKMAAVVGARVAWAPRNTSSITSGTVTETEP